MVRSFRDTVRSRAICHTVTCVGGSDVPGCVIVNPVGYNLTDNMSGVCPECGTTVANLEGVE